MPTTKAQNKASCSYFSKQDACRCISLGYNKQEAAVTQAWWVCYYCYVYRWNVLWFSMHKHCWCISLQHDKQAGFNLHTDTGHDNYIQCEQMTSIIG